MFSGVAVSGWPRIRGTSLAVGRLAGQASKVLGTSQPKPRGSTEGIPKCQQGCLHPESSSSQVRSPVDVSLELNVFLACVAGCQEAGSPQTPVLSSPVPSEWPQGPCPPGLSAPSSVLPGPPVPPPKWGPCFLCHQHPEIVHRQCACPPAPRVPCLHPVPLPCVTGIRLFVPLFKTNWPPTALPGPRNKVSCHSVPAASAELPGHGWVRSRSP